MNITIDRRQAEDGCLEFTITAEHGKEKHKAVVSVEPSIDDRQVLSATLREMTYAIRCLLSVSGGREPGYPNLLRDQ